jgi:CMP/dCMP kinase
MALPKIIAIDGPVASGKTVVGRRLADLLGYLFFDTGVMYRAVTYLALSALGSVDDAEAVTQVAERAVIDVRPPDVADGRDYTVLGDGADITSRIREPRVEDTVSPVSAIPRVRQCLTQQMRRIGLRGRAVMVGRDVGTVILPEADLKIFLTASVETRAHRRFLETQARGEPRTYEDILANLRDRDRIDSSRAVAPLKVAADALELDTTDMDLQSVFHALQQAGRARGYDLG